MIAFIPLGSRLATDLDQQLVDVDPCVPEREVAHDLPAT